MNNFDKRYAFILLPLFFQSVLMLVKAQGSRNEEETVMGELTDSRFRSKKTYYKCYAGEEGNGNELSECTGRRCYRLIHHQSSGTTLFCKNFTETDDPEPGKCKKIFERQMPGQTETLCSCEEDYCNSATGNSYSFILLSICVLAFLLCSSFVGAILFRR